MIAYTVVATFPDLATRDEYVVWLRDGHVQAVVASGASSGQILILEEPAEPPRVEARYAFPDRSAYERYLRDHAPALRADGLARFPAHRGVRFERRLGTVTFSA